MDANRMPEMTDARRLGLAMLLGRRQGDDLLAFRVAQRLAASAPQRRGQAA
jgi:hypothetical protein